MSVARKLKALPQIQDVPPTMLLTRVEDCWVEPERGEAEALLAAGHGHRAAVGELGHVELEAVRTDEE
jgi:hypothetical protein